MKTSRYEKKSSPLTIGPAVGSDGLDLCVTWTATRKDVSYVGTVKARKRFEIVQGKFNFSLYDVSLPLGFQFIDNYEFFADATEASVLILDLEAQQEARATLRNTARAALIEFNLIRA